MENQNLESQVRFENKERKDDSAVVYEVSCNDYTKIYSGGTGHKLKERIKEDTSDGEKDKKKENITGLSHHMKEKAHKLAWENIKIIRNENNWREKKFENATRITFHKKNQLMNKNEEIKTISNFCNIVLNDSN